MGTQARIAPLTGWLILDKPRGMGSTEAVGAVKRVLRQSGHARTKVGHGGTLDPLAEGVLPIALGEATKLVGRMLDASKIYQFTIRFGEQTDTLDTEGAVVARSDTRPTRAALEGILPRFTGLIEQVPPAYSALKVEGQRAYALARAGAPVALKPRAVVIHALRICYAEPVSAPVCAPEGFGQKHGGTLSWLEDNAVLSAVTLEAHVSKGTYIRALARDIAAALGSCGYVTYLRRIKAGPFDRQQAISLDKLEEIAKDGRLEDLILPLEAGLDDIPALALDQTSAQAVRQGRVLSGVPHSSGLYLAKLGAIPVALVKVTDGIAKVVRGFNLSDVAK
jgi:tRNA pseudouridine55 synthase